MSTLPSRTPLFSVIAVAAILAGLEATRGPREIWPSLGAEDSSTDRFSTQWIDRTPEGRAGRSMPAGAEDYTMIYDPVQRRIVFFGGEDGIGEVWTFDPARGVWEKPKVTGKTPPVTEDSTAIYDPIGRRMILYGGEDKSATNALWALDLKTSSWRNMTSRAAPAREGHTAVFDSRAKQMVVFGGADGAKADLYDIWALDLDSSSPTFEQWRNLTVEEGRPPGRLNHVAVYDAQKNRMVIHAGRAKATKVYYSDTWAFSFADAADGKGRWTRVINQSRPPDRRDGAAANDAARNWLIVFGGQGKAGYLNDLWAFDLTEDQWVQITPAGRAPPPRTSHRAVYDPTTESLIVYGGQSAVDAGRLQDIWELQIRPGTQSGELPGASAASRPRRLLLQPSPEVGRLP